LTSSLSIFSPLNKELAAAALLNYNFFFGDVSGLTFSLD
jgi:hypothetical protein